MKNNFKLRSTYTLSVNNYLILRRAFKTLPQAIKFKYSMPRIFHKILGLILLMIFTICPFYLIGTIIDFSAQQMPFAYTLGMLTGLVFVIPFFRFLNLYDVAFLLRLFHPSYYRYSNKKPKSINVTYDNNFCPISKIPKYKDLNTFNIPKRIDYLMFTKYWFLMLNKNYRIIGYFPRNVDDQAFMQYVTTNCQIKHMDFWIISLFGKAYSFGIIG